MQEQFEEFEGGAVSRMAKIFVSGGTITAGAELIPFTAIYRCEKQGSGI
jgi:hypothetical protein